MLSRRFIPCLALASLAGLAHAADLPTLHAALARRVIAGPRDTFASPSDAVAFFLSAWMVTGDEACLRAAREQLTLSHGHINRDGLYETPGADGRAIISTRSSVDHLLAYWLAARLLDEHALQVHLDRCVDGMLQSLARQPVKAADGRTYVLFAPGYEAARPCRALAPADVSPERDAAIGLVFTLLYHDERSKWFHDEAIRDIALNELHMSMTTQRLGSGAILPGGPAVEDRADPSFGAAVTFAWSWANRLWQEPETEVRIRRAVDWLDPYFDGAMRAGRWAPERKGMTTKAMWQVFAAFSDHGRDLRRLMGLYESALADPSASPTGGQVYLYLIGLPADALKLAGLSGRWLPAPKTGE